MRGALFAILALLAANAAAQTTYKCTDAQRRITYSNEACDKQGLKGAGPVADRTTTVPLGPLPKPASKGPAAKDAKDSKDGKEEKQAK